MPESAKKYTRLAVCVLGASLLGILSGAVAGDIKTAYEALEKPSIPIFAPAGIYGLVWPLMYICIGLALFFLLNVESLEKKTGPLVLFGVQMVINVIWSPLFFRYGSAWVALGLILLLDLLVFFSVISFSRYSDLSAVFLIPYFFWLLYLTLVSAAIIFNSMI